MEEMSVQDHRHELHSLHGSKVLNLTSPSIVEDGISKQLTKTCGHFSIRAYALEARNNNWKNSWPFSLPNDERKLEACRNLLPPMVIKKSRWWGCKKCLLDFNASTAEVVPVEVDLNQTSAPDDNLSKDPSTPDYNDTSSQCIEILRDDISNGFEISEDTSISDDQIKEAALLASRNDLSPGATQVVTIFPVQKGIVGEVEQENSVSRENFNVGITLDLNEPACTSLSDEVECRVSAGGIEFGASNGAELPFTNHIFYDVGCSNFCTNPYGEATMKGLNSENIFSLNNVVPREIDFGIKEVHPPLAALNPFNQNVFREADHEHDDDFSRRKDVVGDGITRSMFHGKMKKRKTQKIRLLSDILQKDNLNARKGDDRISMKVKKNKCIGGSEVETPAHFPNVSARVLPQEVDSQSGRVPPLEVDSQNGRVPPQEVHSQNGRVLPQEVHSQNASEETKSDDVSKHTGKNTNRKKSKLCSYKDKPSLTLKGVARLEILNSLNGISKAKPLGRHKKKIIRGNLQSRESEIGDNPTWRKDDDSIHGAISSSEGLFDTPNSHVPKQRTARTGRETSVDDIPMDIVELLAKHQHERLLNNSPAMTDNAGDKSGTILKYAANRDDPPLHNAQSSRPSSHSKRLDSLNLINRQPERRWTLEEFSPLLQNHGKPTIFQNSFHGHSNNDDHGSPVSCMQFLEDCRQNQMAFQNLNIKDRCVASYEKSGLVASQNALGKGKGVLESNNKRSLSFPASSGKEKILSNEVGRSADLCHNETVSALSLLMLMQQGASSSTPSTSRRKNILKQPHFPISQESSKLGSETFARNQFPGYSKPFEDVSQNHKVKNTFELFPNLGKSGEDCSLPLRKQSRCSNPNQSFGLDIGFSADLLNFTPNIHARRLNKAVQDLDLSGTNAISTRPGKSAAPSGLLKHPKFPCTRRILPLNNVKSKKSTKKTAGSEICSLNKNPADFTLPVAGNIYMIGPEELGPVRSTSTRGSFNGRKKNKKQKIDTT